MEPALRGIIEQVIDNELSEDMLGGNYRIFNQFKNRGLIESVASAMFGRIYTRAFSTWLEYKASYGKPVNQNEATEFGRIFEARAMEIRSKITEQASL
jgi:hypothetical protein